MNNDKLKNNIQRNIYLSDERDLLDRQISLLKENNYPPEEIQALEKQRAAVDETFHKKEYSSLEPETIGQKTYDYFYEPNRDIWDKVNQTYPEGNDGELMRQYDNRRAMLEKVNNGTYSLDDYKNSSYKTIPQIAVSPENSQQNTASADNLTLENAKNYLRTAKQLGYTALNGYSLGYLDELYGAVESGAYGATEQFLKAFAGYQPKESTWNSMKATYLQGRDEMRGELQQVKDEHPTLANIADAAGSAVSPVNIFSKGNSFNVVKNVRYPNFSSIPYGSVGNITKNQLLNSTANGVIAGIGNSDENSFNSYATNIGKSMIGNFAGNGAGNTLFGRNLEHSLGRTVGNAVVGTAVNSAFNSLEDFMRKK